MRKNILLYKGRDFHEIPIWKDVTSTQWNDPVWQRNYYEHIIRNDKELYELRKYIENNPTNWKDDEYY